MGPLAALARSHLMGDHPWRLTKEQTTETTDPSLKTKGLRLYPRQWNLELVGAARIPQINCTALTETPLLYNTKYVMLIPLLCLNRPTKKWILVLVENNFMYLRLHFFDCVVFTVNQPLQEDHNLPMHRRHLRHMLCNLDFDYEPERRHMGSRLACPGRGFLPDLSPVSLQRVSIHLDLKRN